MPQVAVQPPVDEQGRVSPASAMPFGGALTSSIFVDDREYVDAFRWPRSVDTVERMRTDSQLAGLERATILPPTRWAWGIDANGARPELVDAACREFNLPLIDDAIQERLTGRPAKPVGRAGNRFNFAEHQRLAFRAIRYGHYYFEQNAAIVKDGPASLNGGWFAHLRKLKPLPPWTIGEIDTDPVTGGLRWIKQQVGLDAPQLDVSRLVVYVWDQEPGNWVGTSMYRSCYREWRRKDVLLKVDAVNHEKGGGVWWGEAPQGATAAEIAELAGLAVKAGSGGGAAVPNGAKLHLERPGGSTGASVVDSINRDDEAMARAWLLMVIQLGQTQTGSRAVGDNFETLHGTFQEALALWFQGTFNEHVLEDWADWNYGPDEEFVPRLVFVRPENYRPTSDLEAVAETDPAVAAAVDQVKAALESGELDEWLVARLRLKDARRFVVDGPGSAASLRQLARAARAAVAELPLPDRQLRRQPYDHEVRAQVDFAALDKTWATELDQLIATWGAVRTSQVSDLRAQIEAAAGDLAKLATVQAPTVGADAIGPVLTRAAVAAAAEAVAEAKRQGLVDAAAPALDDAALTARAGAVAELLARSLSEAAGRKAVQLSGGTLAAGEVADQVASHLDGLSDTYLRDQLGGAITAAQNTGRLAVMAALKPSRIYASELLDVNCCQPCVAEDGTEFASLEEAAKAYPTGGYRLCQGGPRCRGTLVAVYDEAAPTS